MMKSKYVYDNILFNADTIALPAFSPDPDTGEGTFVEFMRKKCFAGSLFGMGWDINRGQKESTGRAFAKMQDDTDANIRGIIRIYRFNAAGVSEDLVAELDLTEMNATELDRTTWRVLADLNMLIKENSTFRFFMMSKESTAKTLSKANTKIFIDGYKIIT